MPRFSRARRMFSLHPDSEDEGEAEASSASSQRLYGMHVLVDQDRDVFEGTDIVAIHGLNGHYFKTWRDSKTDFNWLKKAIPEAIPKARVMSFAYDSSLQFSKSDSDVYDFADQLLEALRVERQSRGEQARPIVFICHSLGGIVFKQAMIRAFECDRYKSLLQNTAGVMFLGTPHRGSPLANWSTILARILNVAAFGSSTNTRLSKDLAPKSRALEQISRSFIERTEDMSIFSFYETAKMDYFNSVVVEKESACMGLKGEISIPLNGDHRTICKYDSTNDGNLRIILSNLKDLCKTGQKSELPAQAMSVGETSAAQLRLNAAELLSRLQTSSPEFHKARNLPPTKGTCGWLLQHSKYKSWFASPNSSLLWLSADPGCGKSVLACYLVDHYSNLPIEERPNICYFFFKSDNTEQRDAIHAMQAVLRQMLLRNKKLVDVVLPSLNKHTIGHVQSLWNAFITAISHPDPDAADTICILDGLDECEMVSRKQLSSLISRYFSDTALGETSTKSSRLKLLIASRPENAFKIAFERPGIRPDDKSKAGRISMIRLRGEDEIEAITNDVSTVIKSDIADLQYQGLPSEILEDIERELIARADRTFLWVTLILQLLKERVEAGASRRELDEILESRDIDATYHQLLSGRPNEPKARKVLNLVLGALRPLTVEELSIALAIDGRLTTNFDQVEGALVFPYENHIKSLCGHFLRIIRNSVYFVHETARQFLLASWKRPDLVSNSVQWKGSFEMKAARLLLLEICVAFLYCFSKPSTWTQIGSASRRAAPFIEYVAVHWPTHFKELKRDTELTSSARADYYNLCHPKFPGFKEWVPRALGVPLEILMPKNTGLSPDEIQDFCRRKLLSDDPKTRDDFDMDGFGDYGFQKFSAYSSNPGALENHYFPLKTDEEGIVRLDFSKGPQSKQSSRRWSRRS